VVSAPHDDLRLWLVDDSDHGSDHALRVDDRRQWAI
jgi:hypothetical protein